MSEQELREQLQAAQAEAAVLREALMLARDWERCTDREVLRARYRYLLKGALTTQARDAVTDAALSGDAGAAFLREHEVMRAALEQLAEHARIAGDANPHCPAFRVIARRARAALSGDALSAPAAEPEVQP